MVGNGPPLEFHVGSKVWGLLIAWVWHVLVCGYAPALAKEIETEVNVYPSTRWPSRRYVFCLTHEQSLSRLAMFRWYRVSCFESTVRFYVKIFDRIAKGVLSDLVFSQNIWPT